MASVLWVDHFAELEKAGGANPWIMNQCDPDHAYRWVDVTRFLAKQLSRHDLDASPTISGYSESNIIAGDSDPQVMAIQGITSG